MTPTLSIIIPIYNTGAVALPLIELILNHPCKNLELICVDDGSSDNSFALIKKTFKNSRLKLLTQPNGGPSKARNTGINISSGAYLLFIDSDDFIHPDFITTLLSAIKKPGIDLALTAVSHHIVSSNTTYPTQTKKLKPQGKRESKAAYILRLLLADGRMYVVTNKIYKSSIITANQLRFDESINFAEDLKFVLEYLKYASGDIKFVRKPLYTYNFGTPTSIVRTAAMKKSNWTKSYRHLKSWVKSLSSSPLPSLRESLLLKIVWFRWKISHTLAIMKSDLSRREKLRRADFIFLLPAVILNRLRHHRK